VACNVRCRRPVSTRVAFLNLAATRAKKFFAIFTTLVFAWTCFAQISMAQQNQGQQNSFQQNQSQQEQGQQDQRQQDQDPLHQPYPQGSPQNVPATITIPAGSNFALVLTNPVSSKVVHSGDTVYAQTTAPVLVGEQIVIPAGSFVQAQVAKLSRSGSRGMMEMQSASVIFPDGYVAKIRGPLHVESDEGTAWVNPSGGAKAGAIIAPMAGLGIGAAAGAAAHTTTSTTLDGTTLTSSSPKGVAIGSGIGLGVGALVSVALLLHSRQFFIDVGSPMEMTLPQPVTLAMNEVQTAVQNAKDHPAPVPMAAPRPVPYYDRGTCYMPGSPGTPSTMIPGTPGPDGIPGPPTMIPGTPPTPPTPYPCP
jgi:hypothetical protein